MLYIPLIATTLPPLSMGVKQNSFDASALQIMGDIGFG